MEKDKQKNNKQFTICNLEKSLFEVTYQGQDDKGLIVKTITVQAESASEAAEKVRDCGAQLKIHSSIACN